MGNFKTKWRNPPNKLTLKQNEVHVWHGNPNRKVSLHNKLRLTLNTEERQWANSFYFEKDRLHFIAVRGLLRVTLGSNLKTTPSKLHIIYNTHGKPTIANGTKEMILNLYQNVYKCTGVSFKERFIIWVIFGIFWNNDRSGALICPSAFFY